jgi:hypothetical protein
MVIHLAINRSAKKPGSKDPGFFIVRLPAEPEEERRKKL